LSENKPPLLPTDDAIIEANDRLIALTRSDSEEALCAALIATTDILNHFGQ
jgi:hypothetical protein